MKTHKYVLTIKFESEKPVTKHADWAIQFENGLGYFADNKVPNNNINESFIYGSGRARLVKMKEIKK